MLSIQRRGSTPILFSRVRISPPVLKCVAPLFQCSEVAIEDRCPSRIPPNRCASHQRVVHSPSENQAANVEIHDRLRVPNAISLSNFPASDCMEEFEICGKTIRTSRHELCIPRPLHRVRPKLRNVPYDSSEIEKCVVCPLRIACMWRGHIALSASVSKTKYPAFESLSDDSCHKMPVIRRTSSGQLS